MLSRSHPFERVMFFPNAHQVVVNGGSFTDVHGNVNHFQSDPVQKAAQGILQLRDAISGGATHDSDARYPPHKCHPATRKAVLKRILQWIGLSSPGNNVLWLHGPAGAGKSAIAQTVAERTESRELAASFFFSRGIAGRNTIHRLWATIAFQIATAMPDLQSKIGTAVMDNPGIFFKAPDSQLQKLVMEPLRSRATASTASQRSPFLVIVDGLDECEGDTNQVLILRSISTITHILHLPLRFIIASRPEPHIRGAFDSPDLRYICHHIILDESFQPVQDVYTFLRSEFNNIYEKHRHTMTSISRPWPSEDKVRLIADRSGGQFIYASTALKFIDDKDCRPAEQLEIVLDASGSTAFTELDQLYQQILSTSANIPLLLHILGCILMAKEDLCASTIETFLKLQVGDVHLALRRVHSIVNIPDNSTEPIHVLHKSLADFIFNKSRSGAYYISPEECHFNLAVGCLRWALDAGSSYDYTLCPHSLSTIQTPSCVYARRHWADHCSKAEPKQELALRLMVADHRSWSVLLHDDRSEVTWVNTMKLNTTVHWLQDLNTPSSRDVIRQLHKQRDQKVLQLEFDPQCVLQCFFTTFIRLQICTLAELVRHAEVHVRMYLDFNHDDDDLEIHDFVIKEGDYKHEYLALSCLELLIGIDTSTQQTSATHEFDSSTRIPRHRDSIRKAAMNYAKKYWAKHLTNTTINPLGRLSRCHCHNDKQVEIWDYLKRVASSFYLLHLDGGDALLVVRWLKGLPNVQNELVSQWEDIAGRSEENEEIKSETSRKDSEGQVYMTWAEQKTSEKRSFAHRMKGRLKLGGGSIT